MESLAELLLRHPEDAEALRAALRAQGEAAGETLVSALSSSDLGLRLIALKLLPEFGGEEATEPVLRLLWEQTRRRGAECRGWREWLTFLLSPWFRRTRREIRETEVMLIRRNVAYAMGRLPPSQQGRAALLYLATDQDEHTRRFAREALGGQAPED